MSKKVYKLKSDQVDKKNYKIDYKNELNQEQLNVVLNAEGACLVLAGAGSGKTRTLVYRLAYLLESGIEPEEILLMTFTNKAAQEMSSRVEELLGLYPKGLWAGTFHHIGNKILRKHIKKLGYTSSYTIMDEGDAYDLINNIIGSIDIQKDKYFPKARVIKNIISFATNAGVSIETAINKRFNFLENETVDWIKIINTRYKTKKKELNVLDYDDLLVLWLKLLEEHPDFLESLSKTFKYILVDEYQDTNHIQASIIKKLANYHKNILVVGDDAQSIYSFRAADIKNILSFPNIFEDTKTFRLETNYRSTPEILALANASIANNTEQFSKNLKPSQPSGNKPIIAGVNNTEQQAKFVTQKILELNDEGLPLNKIAILIRADYHALELELQLNKKSIPYIKRGGMKFFEQAHLKDMVAFLKIIQNPQDQIAWTRVLLLQPSIGKATAVKITSRLLDSDLANIISNEYGLRTKALKSWQNLQQLFNRILTIDQKQISQILEIILEDNYTDYAHSSFDNAQKRIEDIEQFINFSDKYNSLGTFLSDITLSENFQTQGATETQQQKEQIILSTIHQAKGLEWDSVFVIHLASGQFPHNKSIENRLEFEEERRLFYVATTRAKKELYLLYPITLYSHSTGMTFANPSEFIRELDPILYDEGNIESIYPLSGSKQNRNSDDLPTIEYLPEV